MNNFIYDIPVKIYFGENQLQHLSEELAKFGKRAVPSSARASMTP